jgi:hypothetical protein
LRAVIHIYKRYAYSTVWIERIFVRMIDQVMALDSNDQENNKDIKVVIYFMSLLYLSREQRKEITLKGLSEMVFGVSRTGMKVTWVR